MIKISNRKNTIGTYITKYFPGIINANLFRIMLTFIKKDSLTLVLVSHRFSGNVKSFYLLMRLNHPEYVLYFLTDDPDSYKREKAVNKDIDILNIQNPFHWYKICKAKTIMTTHGSSFFMAWKNSKLRPIFIEVWHGVGFKGRNKASVDSFSFYDKIFVSSPFFKDLHMNWGFPENQLEVTGYARTDDLINFKPTINNRSTIFKDFGLPPITTKIILIALTYQPTLTNQNKMFGNEINHAIDILRSFARKNKVTILLRPHLNSDIKLSIKNDKFIKIVPFSTYPDTEKLLKVVDVLVTDWSSIFTDFLVFNKPIIFYDNPPDFDGTSLLANDRIGKVVKNISQLTNQLDNAVNYPTKYIKQNKRSYDTVKKKAWGRTLDGKSSERYYKIIKELIDER